MRYWNKFCDEQVMNYVSMHGWHRMVGIIARKLDGGELERLMEHIPLPDQRAKWRTARSGFSESDLAHATGKILYAVNKVEKQLTQTAWIAGDDYTLADINFYSYCWVAHLDGPRQISRMRRTPSAAEEIQLEKHRVRIEDENLPQGDRGDFVEAMLEAAALEPRQHLLVARASERHVMQRAGRPRPYIAVVRARAIQAVDVHNRAAA
jgi:hypothetical protein